MFKALKDNKIIAINETGYFPCLVHDSVEEDTEHSVSDYVQVNGGYVLTSSVEAIEQKKEEVRSVRNQYLAETDKFMISDFPVSRDEKAKYKAYREYLRDYTEQEDWFEQNPMNFEEWKDEQ